MDEEKYFEVRITPIAVFTAAAVLILSIYGAASAGRDIVMLCLKLSGKL